MEKIKNNLDDIKREFKKPLKEFYLGFFVFVLIFTAAPCFLLASSSAWSQKDWSGGGGQTNWLDATKFFNSTNINFSGFGELILSSSGGGGGVDTWSRSIGSDAGDDSLPSFKQTLDDGYVVARSSFSLATWDYNVLILRLDSNGNTLWQKNYGEDGSDDIVNSIEETNDGGYVLTGLTTSYGAGSDDLWILKLDSGGNIVWQKTYGGGGGENGGLIIQTLDGGFAVGGSTTSYGAGSDDLWILKLDSGGNIVWQKTYGGGGVDYGRSIRQTLNGGYIVGGGTDSYGAGSNDVWILKLDSSGNIVWQKTYGDVGMDDVYSVEQTADGGYFAATFTDSFGAGNSDVWILKLDSNGNIVWQKTYGGARDENVAMAQQTSDGGYVVASSSNSFGAGDYDFWVLKLNSVGEITWQKNYSGSSGGFDDYINAVQQVSDGGYVILGDSGSFGSNIQTWMLKIDQDGSIGSPCSISITDSTATSSDTTVVPSDSATIPADTTAAPADSAATGTSFASSNSFICSAFTQGTWVGGPGQVNWADETMFNTSNQLDYSTSNLLKLGTDPTITAPSWLHTHLDSTSSSFNDVVGTTDGGYIAVGYKEIEDSLIVKVDGSGVVEWRITYDTDFPNGSELLSVKKTSDGGYITAGRYWDSYNYGLIIKFDSNGTISWSKKIGDGSNDYSFNSILEDTDGNYTAVGVYHETISGNEEGLVVKLDKDNVENIVWQKIIGLTQEGFYQVIESSTGGYILAGYTGSMGAGSSDAWLVKLNTDGSIAWQKSYGDSYSNSFLSVIESSDGGYVMSGIGANGSGLGMWVVKTDASGVLLWEKLYTDDSGPNSSASSIEEDSSGNYFVSGATSGENCGEGCNHVPAVIKIDSSGNLIFAKKYQPIAGGEEGEFNSSFLDTDGFLVLAGRYYVPSEGALLAKIRPNGKITDSCAQVNDVIMNVSETSVAEAPTAGSSSDALTVSADQTFTLNDEGTIVGEVCALGYYTDGELESSNYDLGSVVTWGPLSFIGSIPVGTNLSFGVSTDGGLIWQAVTDFVSQIFGASSSVSYRVNMSTTDTGETPILNSVSVKSSSGGGGLVYDTTGSLISSVYDSENSKTIWGPISYVATTPANTSTSIDVSMDGGSTWHTVTDFVSQTFGPSQTLQYRINLVTTDNSVTPVFESISIAYGVEGGGTSGGGKVEPIVCILPQILVDGVCKTPIFEPIFPISPIPGEKTKPINPFQIPIDIELPPSQIIPEEIQKEKPVEKQKPISPPKEFEILPDIKNIISDPIIKVVGEMAIVVSLAFSLLAMINLLLSGVPLVNRAVYSSISFLQFLGFLAKPKSWGIVYDSISKRPIPHARVEILDEKSRKLKSTLADENGKYGFWDSRRLSRAQLWAYHQKYSFPSRGEPTLNERRMYPHIYKGGLIDNFKDLSNFDLPMDPANQGFSGRSNLGISSIRLNNFLAVSANVLFVLGTILGIINVIINPGLLSYGLLAVVFLTFLLRMMGFKFKFLSKDGLVKR